jgi:hypothetical protein
MAGDWVIWGVKRPRKAFTVRDIQGVERAYELAYGVSRVTGFPSTATFRMHPDFPTDTLPSDNIVNVGDLILVSDRLRQFLETRHLEKVEFLPVTILNHKKRALRERYTLVHPIEPVECLDADKSGADWSDDKDIIWDVERIVLRNKDIPKSRQLFRPRFFPKIVLVRRDLADAMSAAEFSAVRWIELSDYPRPGGG